MDRQLLSWLRHRARVLFAGALLGGIIYLGLSLPAHTVVSFTPWDNTHDSPNSGPVPANAAENTPPSIPDEPLEIYEWSPSAWDIPQVHLRAKAYKPPADPVLPIPDPFPLLSQNPPPSRNLLQPPRANRPPKIHVPEQTPLFIGFTRNWPQLLQCVVSYVAAGWPAEDIWVVENTGAMDANARGRLTLQNPFYLNHTQLGMLGVRVIMVCNPFSSQERLKGGWLTDCWIDADALDVCAVAELLSVVSFYLVIPLNFCILFIC